MKHYLLFIVVISIAASCPAVTIFQTWDVNDWTVNRGANAPSETKIEIRKGDANEGAYLYADMYRSDDDGGITSIYVPLGDANIPAGTTDAV